MSLACRCAVSVAALLLVTACTSHDDSATTTSSSLVAPTTVAPVEVPTNPQPDTTANSGIGHLAGAQLDCADPIAVEAPPDSLQVIGGAIALQTSRSLSTPLQLSRTVGTGSSELQFAKTGLVVRAGEQVEIVVVPTAGRTGLVWWGNTGNDQPTARFLVGPCTTGGGWLVFPGGYWVSQPGCVTLVVRHEGIDEYVKAAVGAPCDGPG
jgi:hypothetical protein